MPKNSAVGQEAYRFVRRGRYLSAIEPLRAEYRSWEETPVAANFLLEALMGIAPLSIYQMCVDDPSFSLEPRVGRRKYRCTL